MVPMNITYSSVLAKYRNTINQIFSNYSSSQKRQGESTQLLVFFEEG